MAPASITTSDAFENNSVDRLDIRALRAEPVSVEVGKLSILEVERQRRKERLAAGLRIMQKQGLIHYIVSYSYLNASHDLSKRR